MKISDFREAYHNTQSLGTGLFINHSNKDSQLMIQYTRKLRHLVPTLAFMLGSDAMASDEEIASIVYAPALLQTIPTLSGSMLVVLGLLLAVLAFCVLRDHSASKPLASIVAVGILALGVASGNQLMQNAQASVVAPLFDNPSGGITVVYESFSGEQGIRNTSGQPQRIISGKSNSHEFASTTQQPRCSVGLIVQNNNFCYINLTVSAPHGTGSTSVNFGSNFYNTGN